jgi:SAM-dependent methyltransferase
MTEPARHWADQLAAWRIPERILAVAPRSPWIHPVSQFRVDDGPAAQSPSVAAASEALQAGVRAGARARAMAGGPSVLDVGCGGGRAAFAVAPPAVQVIGVDHQQGMLDAFAETAGRRGLAHREILGDWPDVAPAAPIADVAVCHHVAYNVADLGGFVAALDAHARRRVVLELPWRHPLAPMAPLWKHFWNLDRPDGPTARDALAVILELRPDAALVEWRESPDAAGRRTAAPQEQVEFTRIRLCLTPDRDAEIAQVMAETPAEPRRLATIWWNVPG